ncbi:hypothetical protein GCK32_013051 [Trichostrongylus colubriformis]|uniref:Uncharacterized protein n=1 Tax=Trichostrongylus colubriformis TaxID=6319 RepID=A0AAN8EU18_TRICO
MLNPRADQSDNRLKKSAQASTKEPNRCDPALETDERTNALYDLRRMSRKAEEDADFSVVKRTTFVNIEHPPRGMRISSPTTNYQR